MIKTIRRFTTIAKLLPDISVGVFPPTYWVLKRGKVIDKKEKGGPIAILLQWRLASERRDVSAFSGLVDEQATVYVSFPTWLSLPSRR